MHRTRGHRIAFWLLAALVTVWISPFVVQVTIPGVHQPRVHLDPASPDLKAHVATARRVLASQRRVRIGWAGEMADVHNPDVVNHYTHFALARLSLVRFHQYPWRTHLVGGGTYLAGHPRDVTLSPFFLPALLFGDAIGMKVTTAAMFYIGALGMFYLCRRCLRFSPAGSFYAGALLVVSAWLPTRLNSGNYDEWHFMLFPLVLACFLQARRNRRYLIGAAMLLFPVVLDGKYILPILFLCLFLFAFGEMARRVWPRVWAWLRRRRGPVGSARGWWAPAPRLVAVGLLVVLLAAVKIIPMTGTLRTDDRAREDRYAKVVDQWPAFHRAIRLPRYLRAYAEAWVAQAPPWNLDIRGLGMGPTALFLALVGFAAHPRRMAGWMLFTLISLWLSLWAAMPFDLFWLLDKLPLFRSINSPEKYFNWGVLFGLCVLGGRLITTIGEGIRHDHPLPHPPPSRGRGTERRRGRVWSALAVALVVLAVAEPFGFNFTVQQRLFRRGPVSAPWQRDFYPVLATDPARDLQRQYRDYFFVTRNIGVINWYDPLDLPRAAVPKVFVKAIRTADRGSPRAPRNVLPDGFTERPNPDYQGEAHFLLPGNRATVAELTPNRLRIDVTIDTPDTLVINQNHDGRWRTDRGALTSVRMDTPDHLLLRLADPTADPLKYDRTHRALTQLAVRLDEPGAYTVTLRYRPTDAYLGAAISALAWLVCLAILLRAAAKRRPAATSEESPPTAVGGTQTGVRNPAGS